MAAIIVLFLIIIFIAAAKGDFSGILMVFQWVLYVGAFLLFGWVFIQSPIAAIILLGVIFAIIYSIAKKSNNKKENKSSNNKNILSSNSNQQIKNDISLTGFKAELQDNTKTLIEAEDEKWQAQKSQIDSNIQLTYKLIKDELLDKAKRGEYFVINNKRRIILDHEYNFSPNCMSRTITKNPTGTFKTNNYRENVKISYTISDLKYYNYLISTITDLAKVDDIVIQVVYKEKMINKEKEHIIINLPYTYTETFIDYSHKLIPYLRCTVEY